jgi:serine/threonine protein kinase/tetratricopeptide (TPR) repeat protein
MAAWLSDYQFIDAQSSHELTAPPQERYAQALVSRLVEEMAVSWRNGDRASAEIFLARHSELVGDPDAALRLIYEEICLRQEAGEEVSIDEITRRFPQWQSELRALLECHDVLQPSTAAGPLPAVGETLADFKLLKELGRGTQGRVFLAAQTRLADRLVVLKVTPQAGQEHLSLARLQHTHIVPLYAVQDVQARNLRWLCMPFLGGATLAHLLEELRGVPLELRTGQRLLDLLDRAQVPMPADLRRRGPSREALARASYIEAVCWIGACLAEALHYAHERGLLHLDVKPSNVLLASDGQPMLLDFHLARGPLAKGAPPPDWLGGTFAYMAPEQRAAIKSVSERQAIAEAVTNRTDVYALGLVLYEALSATLPGVGDRPRLERINPQVSIGLADIVHKCLAPVVTNRYADAALLAADLRRHLGHLPLRGVPNRSIGERWRKWRRRRPRALVGQLVVLVLVGVAATAAATAWGFLAQQRAFARAALHDGREALSQGRPEDAERTLSRAAQQVATLPASGDLAQDVARELKRAKRAVAARDLHAAVARLRLLYDGPGASPIDLGPLAERCRATWDRRDSLIRPEEAEQIPAIEQQIQIDLLDLVLLWTDIHVGQAPQDVLETAQREALATLREADLLFGPSPVVASREQALAEALGLRGQAAEAERRSAQIPPRTAWEHVAIGRLLLHRAAYQQASVEFKKALDLEPEALWPNFYAGVCAYRLEHFEEALAAFHACVTLASRTPECWYNRALAWTALGNITEALRDYDRALRLDPGFAAATLNRGALHCQNKNLDAARTDLQRALTLGADAAAVHYNLARVHLADNEEAAALTHLRRALRHDPRHREALELRERLEEKGK